jgi:hypothetical protein
MAGLVPAIHVFLEAIAAKTWMPATSAGMTPHILAALVIRSRFVVNSTHNSLD